jgi:hypothetical protein
MKLAKIKVHHISMPILERRPELGRERQSTSRPCFHIALSLCTTTYGTNPLCSQGKRVMYRRAAMHISHYGTMAADKRFCAQVCTHAPCCFHAKLPLQPSSTASITSFPLLSITTTLAIGRTLGSFQTFSCNTLLTLHKDRQVQLSSASATLS